MNSLNSNILRYIHFAGYSQLPYIVYFLFGIVILGSTQEGIPTQMTGITIGITLVVIHIFGICFTIIGSRKLELLLLRGIDQQTNCAMRSITFMSL